MRDLATQRPFIIFLPVKPGPDFSKDLEAVARVGYAALKLDEAKVSHKLVATIFAGESNPVPAILVDTDHEALVWDLIRDHGHDVAFFFDAYRVCTGVTEDGATNVVLGALSRKHNTGAANLTHLFRIVDETTVYTVE